METTRTAPKLEIKPATQAANDAVTPHLRLVYHLARVLVRSRGVTVAVEELVGAGTLGLIQALANYDASRGLAFTTYAAPRIRGAMLDELRRMDHVPRSVRRRARAVTRATDTLTGALGTSPNAQQLAAHLAIDRATLWRWQRDGTAARSVPFALSGPDHGAAGAREEHVEDAAGEALDDALTQEQELVAMQAAIRTLGSRERTVLTLYYYEELRLHQIAEVLGVTESRVSQIRTQAIARLREQLARLREPEPSVGAAARRRRLPPSAAPR